MVLTFSPTVNVRCIISHHDYTDEEKFATWYTDEEYDHISHRCQKEINKLNQGKELKDKKYCSRGLEHATTEEARFRCFIIDVSVQAVLEEQMEQRYQHGKKSTCDDNAIAQVYRQVTSECDVVAHLIGVRDAKAAGIVVKATTSTATTAIKKKSPQQPQPKRNALIATAA